MIYRVFVDGECVKEYRHRIQAVIWCFLHGYVYSGRGYTFINDYHVKIEEEEEK